VERAAIKQGSGIPTIPVSTDHRNGDWIATDIYVGEMYLDLDTGMVYTRSGNDIVQPDGSPPTLVWEGTLSQTGVLAPTVDAVNRNSLGGTIVLTYIAAGNYRGTLTGAFATQDKFQGYTNVGSSGGHFYVRWETANSFFLVTKDFTGVSVNNILNFSQLRIEIY
jgi:hypothetical protein